MGENEEQPCVLDFSDISAIVRRNLVGKIFLGSFLERRYIDGLKAYRDVVSVSSGETDVKRSMEEVLKTLMHVSGVRWVGITLRDTSPHHCFWTKLANLPFGQYWFQIRHMRIEHGELFFKLKCIRAYHSDDLHHRHSSEPISTASTEKTMLEEGSKEEYTFNFDCTDLMTQLLEKFGEVRQGMTLENTLLCLRVTVATLIAIVTVLLASVRYLGEFCLRLMRETTLFVHTSTPIILSIIDMCCKMVGGLYILLAMVWRSHNTQQPRPPPPLQYKAPVTPPRRLMSAADLTAQRMHRNEKLRRDFLNSS